MNMKTNRGCNAIDSIKKNQGRLSDSWDRFIKSKKVMLARNLEEDEFRRGYEDIRGLFRK